MQAAASQFHTIPEEAPVLQQCWVSFRPVCIFWGRGSSRVKASCIPLLFFSSSTVWAFNPVWKGLLNDYNYE